MSSYVTRRITVPPKVYQYFSPRLNLSCTGDSLPTLL